MAPLIWINNIDVTHALGRLALLLDQLPLTLEALVGDGKIMHCASDTDQALA